MEKQQFKTSINAPKEKIWNILWGQTTYPKWTAPFAEGSRVETDWKKGSKAVFYDGENNGMVSTIAENIPNEFMSIKHVGTIIKGVEDLDSETTKEWAGALENYTLQTVNDKTELVIDMDITEKYRYYFLKTWPLALEKVKELAEKN